MPALALGSREIADVGVLERLVISTLARIESCSKGTDLDPP